MKTHQPLALLMVAMLLAGSAFGAQPVFGAPAKSKSVPADMPTKGKEKGGLKVLTMMQREFALGHVEVHIGDNNLARMDCTFGNVIFDPKKNLLTIFSEKTRKYCEVSEQDFNHKRKMFTQQTSYKWPMSEWKEHGKQTIAGVKAIRFERHCTNLPPSRSFVEECWIYQDIKTPPWLPKYLNMLMCVGTPQVPGAMLKFQRTWTDSKNKREPKEIQVKLDTFKISKHEVSEDLFKKPAGMTKVKDEMDVTMNDQMESPIGEQIKKFSQGK